MKETLIQITQFLFYLLIVELIVWVVRIKGERIVPDSIMKIILGATVGLLVLIFLFFYLRYRKRG